MDNWKENKTFTCMFKFNSNCLPNFLNKYLKEEIFCFKQNLGTNSAMCCVVPATCFKTLNNHHRTAKILKFLTLGF